MRLLLASARSALTFALSMLSAGRCFNQLDMGEYSSIEVMREKLLLALREGSQGFAFR
jgi:hypothetical protein